MEFHFHTTRKLLLNAAEQAPQLERTISVPETHLTPPASTPFDSSMALTVLVLLAALFFIGFFSVYIRRFADDSSVDLTRRRRRHNPSGEPAFKSDSTAATSLPLFYFGATEPTECPVCLAEFEPNDSVKSIPFCRHVFHPRCIDAWLAVRVSCPLCRTTRLFPGKRSNGEGGDCCDVEGGRSTGERCETWREVGREVMMIPLGRVRRTSSFSGLREEVPSLPRTYSL